MEFNEIRLEHLLFELNKMNFEYEVIFNNSVSRIILTGHKGEKLQLALSTASLLTVAEAFLIQVNKTFERNDSTLSQETIKDLKVISADLSLDKDELKNQLEQVKEIVANFPGKFYENETNIPIKTIYYYRQKNGEWLPDNAQQLLSVRQTYFQKKIFVQNGLIVVRLSSKKGLKYFIGNFDQFLNGESPIKTVEYPWKKITQAVEMENKLRLAMFF